MAGSTDRKTTRQLVEDMTNKYDEWDRRFGKMEDKQHEMYEKLFVQNGSNDGKDCLAVQIQKNTAFRRTTQGDQDNERRSKWRRFGFYLSLAGLLISNILIVIKMLSS